MVAADLKIGFIGGGNMSRAIIGGVLKAGHSPSSIVVADPDTAQLDHVARLHQDIRRVSDNAACAGDSDLLVLAVKPQIMATVTDQIADLPRPADQLIVSVAAGITLSGLEASLGEDTCLVRVMPNQPALVGAGMSVLVANDRVSNQQKSCATYLAEAAGEALWIDNEQLMDAITAVSGSGPAYFYLMMELVEDCAQSFGIDSADARKLVVQTALGAALTAEESDKPLAELRAQVTSPGGTTAAAIAVMETEGLKQIVDAALDAARLRSIELGKG